MNMQDRIDLFLSGTPHAVVGASRDRSKYGNKVLRAYVQTNRAVYPVNPLAETVEGLTAYASLADLPETVHGISIITPPDVTESVVKQASRLDITHVWMQPGAESDAAVECAEKHGINLIAGGPCILVLLGYRE
jgi:predicted CoA-binding protein